MILIIAVFRVIPTIPTPGSPIITSSGVGGTFAFVVILTMDGMAAARGLARLGREIINAASGVGIGKDKGLPIKTHPLAKIDPGTDAGPIPKAIGSLVGFAMGFIESGLADTCN
tara:strand:- start:447 stop:788 length:342 start_codon:yes stop_codon:yes gene_type:complete